MEQEDLEEATRLLATGSKRGEIADVSLALNLAAERGFVDFVELFLVNHMWNRQKTQQQGAATNKLYVPHAGVRHSPC